jgi:hypothetical protein
VIGIGAGLPVGVVQAPVRAAVAPGDLGVSPPPGCVFPRSLLTMLAFISRPPALFIIGRWFMSEVVPAVRGAQGGAPRRAYDMSMYRA